jgi:hypothetical protein
MERFLVKNIPSSAAQFEDLTQRFSKNFRSCNETGEPGIHPTHHDGMRQPFDRMPTPMACLSGANPFFSGVL